MLDDRALAVGRDHRKDLAEIEVNVLIHRCQIPRLSGVWVAGVEKDKGRVRESFDDGLHVGWRRLYESDIVVAKALKSLSMCVHVSHRRRYLYEIALAPRTSEMVAANHKRNAHQVFRSYQQYGEQCEQDDR